MKKMMLLGLLVLSLTGCASWKEAAIDAGKQIASEAAPIIAEKATKAAATAVAEKVAADDALAPEEKQDITDLLYGAGGATAASLLAALRMWALLRAKKAALGVVVKAVDRLPEDMANVVKANVTALGGSAPAIKKTITAAKS